MTAIPFDILITDRWSIEFTNLLVLKIRNNYANSIISCLINSDKLWMHM